MPRRLPGARPSELAIFVVMYTIDGDEGMVRYGVLGMVREKTPGFMSICSKSGIRWRRFRRTF